MLSGNVFKSGGARGMPWNVQIKTDDISVCYRRQEFMRVSERQILPASSKYI
jgi:hypothetical protein